MRLISPTPTLNKAVRMTTLLQQMLKQLVVPSKQPLPH